MSGLRLFTPLLIIICLVLSACGGNEANPAFRDVQASLSVTTGELPLQTQYNVTFEAERGPVAVTWDFGDGQASTVASGTHTFYEPGEFEVSVTLTDSRGISLKRELGVARVAAPGNGLAVWIEADGPSGGEAPLTVTFTAHTWGEFGPLEFEWEMGDGFIRKGRTVTHDFCSEGPFTPRLSVKDASNRTVQTDSTIAYAPEYRARPLLATREHTDTEPESLMTVLSDLSDMWSIGPDWKMASDFPYTQVVTGCSLFGYNNSIHSGRPDAAISTDGSLAVFPVDVTTFYPDRSGSERFERRDKLIKVDPWTGEWEYINIDAELIWIWNVTLSSDGQKVSFRAWDPDRNGRFYLLDVETGEELLSIPDYVDAMSGDFETLFYWDSSYAQYELRLQLADVLTPGERTMLLDQDTYEYSTTLAADRVLLKERFGPEAFVWLAETGSTIQVPKPEGETGSWGKRVSISSDGRRIALPFLPSGSTFQEKLVVMYLEDMSTVVLDTIEDPKVFFDLEFTADGSLLVGANWGPPGSMAELYVAPADLTGIEQVPGINGDIIRGRGW